MSQSRSPGRWDGASVNVILFSANKVGEQVLAGEGKAMDYVQANTLIEQQRALIEAIGRMDQSSGELAKTNIQLNRTIVRLTWLMASAAVVQVFLAVIGVWLALNSMPVGIGPGP